jgi:hypothetical protein
MSKVIGAQHATLVQRDRAWILQMSRWARITPAG